MLLVLAVSNILTLPHLDVGGVGINRRFIGPRWFRAMLNPLDCTMPPGFIGSRRYPHAPIRPSPGPIDRPATYCVQHNPAMLSVIACALCGGEPATETDDLNAAVAGALGTPWLFRDRIAAVVRRLRGKSDDPEASCSLMPDEDDGR